MIQVKYIRDTWDSKVGRIRLVDSSTANALVALGLVVIYRQEKAEVIKAELESVAHSPVARTKRGRPLKK